MSNTRTTITPLHGRNTYVISEETPTDDESTTVRYFFKTPSGSMSYAPHVQYSMASIHPAGLCLRKQTYSFSGSNTFNTYTPPHTEIWFEVANMTRALSPMVAQLKRAENATLNTALLAVTQYQREAMQVVCVSADDRSLFISDLIPDWNQKYGTKGLHPGRVPTNYKPQLVKQQSLSLAADETIAQVTGCTVAGDQVLAITTSSGRLLQGVVKNAQFIQKAALQFETPPQVYLTEKGFLAVQEVGSQITSLYKWHAKSQSFNTMAHWQHLSLLTLKLSLNGRYLVALEDTGADVSDQVQIYDLLAQQAKRLTLEQPVVDVAIGQKSELLILNVPTNDFDRAYPCERVQSGGNVDFMMVRHTVGSVMSSISSLFGGQPQGSVNHDDVKATPSSKP